MSLNFLMLNFDKTDIIVLDPKYIRDSLSNNIVNMDGIILASITTVRDLGVIFNQQLSFNPNLNRFHDLPSFISVTLLKSGPSCLNKMQKN